MVEKGWIKVHRQLQECFIWYGEKFSKGQAWVDLLLLANHRDKKILFNGKTLTVKRGQYLTSSVKLAEKWKWDRKTVTSFLKLLENEKMIKREADNKKTLITIENYDIYQGFDDISEQRNGQPSTRLSSSSIGINNNGKEDKIILSDSKESSERTKDIKNALDAWNDLKSYGIKTVSRMSNNSQRYRRLSARINEYGIEKVLIAIDTIKESDFLQGKNKSGWSITFDWFVLPNNFPKVLDGNYNNKEGGDNNGCIGRNDAKNETDSYADELFKLVQ